MQTLETKAIARTSGFAPFLRVRSVSKWFGDHEVLRNLDLAVQPGEMVAIVGKSGCGKSTLLRLLAGLEKPTNGTIAIDSTPVNGRNRFARLMFQESALLPWDTVLENVRPGCPGSSSPARISPGSTPAGRTGAPGPGLACYPVGRPETTDSTGSRSGQRGRSNPV
jgi:ABC-type multidrug transport system fused ATPase/permease subunit